LRAIAQQRQSNVRPVMRALPLSLDYGRFAPYARDDKVWLSLDFARDDNGVIVA